MTRDEIYDHLAQVYLGKRDRLDEKKRKPFNAWLVINIVITLMILMSTFYGLTAFLTRRGDYSRNSIIFALTNGPVRVNYNLNEPFPQVKTFSFLIPGMNIAKYSHLSFSIRGLEEGSPGVVKVIMKNKRNETAFYYIKEVGLNWQEVDIPFKEFDTITDWTSVSEVSFVLEAWNARKKKGAILIEDVCFAN